MPPPVVISNKRAITTTASSSGAVTAPTIDFNINSSNVGSWHATYHNPIYHGSGMLFASGHQHTDGRMIEWCDGMHGKAAGAGIDGRWVDFNASGAPTFGRYAPVEGDTSYISVTDNFPTFYAPWMSHGGWTAYWNMHVLAMDGTKIFNGAGALYAGPNTGSAFTNIINTGTAAQNSNSLNSNYNPTSLVNPTGNWTCFFGGGLGSSFRQGQAPTMKVVRSNPLFGISGDQRPLYIHNVDMNVTAPIYMRAGAVHLGDYIYWGGTAQGFPDAGGDWYSNPDNWKFWRIHVPSLLNTTYPAPPVVVQEACPNMPYPLVAGIPSGYGSAMVADPVRNRVIHVDYYGVCVLQIPANQSVSGMQWYGPFRIPDQTTWQDSTISIAGGGGYQGLRAVHRAEFGPAGQTFYMPNISNRMSRIRWTN